ncbi:hypothetical protein mEp554_17 [Escherichia phage mEp554]
MFFASQRHRIFKELLRYVPFVLSLIFFLASLQVRLYLVCKFTEWR